MPAKVSAERKKIKSVLGTVPVVRDDLEIFGRERLVKGHSKMSLWLTDDACHIPVRARLLHDVGTLDITLVKVGATKRA